MLEKLISFLRTVFAVVSFLVLKLGLKIGFFYLVFHVSNPHLFILLCFPFFFYHFLMFASPVYSLFIFLFVIIGLAVVLIAFGINYIGFIFISIYGGAILVLFVLVCMLFNKQETLLH